MGDKVMIIEFNESGHFIRQPDIGSVTGTTKVSVTWDDAWTGNEKCLRLIDGNVVFDLNADYLNNRLAAYPPITDQLDTIYHEGIDAWKAVITAVKEEYPKP